MIRVGIVNPETWAFLNEIKEHFNQCYQTSVFSPRTLRVPLIADRVNRRLFRSDLATFLSENDVVFFEWASELLAMATQLPKTCAIVARLHRYEMYQWVDHVNWDAVDRLIVVTEAKRREFVARFPDQAGKVIVIPEAVSLERFQPHHHPYRGQIGMLGNLSPRKRFYELILAFSQLAARHPEMHLHIGGGPHRKYHDYLPNLQSLVQRLNLQERVTFYGRVAEPHKWYEHIDIFVSNSYSEGLQVSLLESIAAGCYPLAHTWEGVDELLPPENLFLTDADLIARIEAYAALPEAERTARKTALQARVCADNNMEDVKDRISVVVEEAAAKRRGAAS